MIFGWTWRLAGKRAIAATSVISLCSANDLMKSRKREEESPGPNQTFQPQRGSEIPFGCRRDLKLKLWSPVNLRIDNPRVSWFCKDHVGAFPRHPDQAHAAQIVENDDQNAPPAEKRDERLNLRSRLPGGPPGSR